MEKTIVIFVYLSVWRARCFKHSASCLILCWDQMVTTVRSNSSTTEKDRPSLQSQKKKKCLSYSPVKQHAVNVGLVLQCDECNKWRLLFSKRSLPFHDRQELERLLSDVSYTCGARIDDLQLPERLMCVEIRAHQCSDSIETLYYSAYPDDILCIHCGSTENIVEREDTAVYPFCTACTTKVRMCKRTKRSEQEK